MVNLTQSNALENDIVQAVKSPDICIPDTCISVRHVYKIFGHDEAQIKTTLELAKSKMSKADILNKTGCNVGLCDINLEIPSGQIFCIMGLSGSGKSTLVRHLNRLIEPTSGEIVLLGQNIMELDTAALNKLRQKTISMVFQNFGLLPHQTVIQNVAFGLLNRGDPQKQAYEQSKIWIDRVGLTGYERKYPDELSGGMRQRVGLARALVMQSPILLMDEAFSALDPLIRYDMQGLLLELQESLHKTIIFITHDLDEALRIGAQIAILKDGELIQVGTPDTILNQPANEYVRRFVEKRG